MATPTPPQPDETASQYFNYLLRFYNLSGREAALLHSVGSAVIAEHGLISVLENEVERLKIEFAQENGLETTEVSE